MLINKVLAANVRLIRKAKGLSLHGFCKASGYRNKTICDLEAGRGNPTLSTLTAVAYTLGVDVWELLKQPEIELFDNYTNQES